ncbi:ABC transporter substrate-binding protein [Nocardioides okcheonensis]|uniref:ABC transporter substrate-binding protein n=1 Tax=Nocardioides okcheonensis TaxID=2894081 RepID=UPI001E5BA1B2|nr:ABC transporter substrate-binding protein [Nocardioides okcheonensis]UFN45475.1 ABC transporter substrate-binding protein [Nocardioides okcheonensis]
MSRSKPLVLGAGAVLVAGLAACAGGPARDDGGNGDRTGGTRAYVEMGAARRDADRRGPAPEVEGAVEGGTLTVYLPGAPGPDTLDPSEAFSAIGNPIQQALVSRSLTQYARGEDGETVLVPDLATDLGRHNEDYTEWTFTIRDDATWEDGSSVTAEQVAFGICRSLDAGEFPAGPGAQYSRTYFAGAEGYLGPYSGEDPTCRDWPGISVDGQDITLEMSRPFPDMDYYGASMAMGPVPVGDASAPGDYKLRPLANGPYRVERWDPAEQLVLVRNEEWDAGSDPARHQYPERWVFKFSQDQAKVDEIMLSDSPRGRAAIATAVGSGRYEEASSSLGERLVQTPTDCVSTLAPDYDKVADVRVRRALAHAFPYRDVWIAGGEVPDVTRVPASSVMPPGMAGRHDVRVGGAQTGYDPARSRELLAEAGHADEPYPITMIYYEVDDQARAAQEQITKGFEAGGFSVRAIPVQESPYNVWLDPDDPLNQKLDVRGASLCPLWPGGSAILPTLLRTGALLNTAGFSEQSVDDEMDRIAMLPVDEQAAAWGALDEKIMSTWFPVIPIAYINRLFVFGTDVGNPSGDSSMGTPNYKDLYLER